MIDTSKKYRTRDGREVTQLTIFKDVGTGLPVKGVIDRLITSWRLDGGYNLDGLHECGTDLIEIIPEQWHYIFKLSEDGDTLISLVGYPTSDIAESESYKFSKRCTSYTLLGTWKLPQEAG